MFKNISNYITANNEFNFDKLKQVIPSASDSDIKYNIASHIKYDTQTDNRIGQTKFRKYLIDTYKKCIITGAIENRCDACHIIPFSSSDLTTKMDIHNGILLRKDLHSLFDKYLITINPQNGTIEINPNYIKKDASLYKINGKSILYDLPAKTISILKHHYLNYKRNIDTV